MRKAKPYFMIVGHREKRSVMGEGATVASLGISSNLFIISVILMHSLWYGKIQTKKKKKRKGGGFVCTIPPLPHH